MQGFHAQNDEQFKNNTEIKVSLDWMTKGRALYGDKSRLAGFMHASRWAKLNDMELRVVRMSMVIPDLAVQFRTRHSFDSITRESDGPFAFLRTKYVKHMAEVEYAGKELFDVVVINPAAKGLIKGVSLLYNEASKTPLVVEK